MRLDFRETMEKIRGSDILTLCGVKISYAKGEQLRCECLLHGSKPGSTTLSINLTNRQFQCFKCKRHGSLLDFYMMANRISNPRDAILEICRLLKISPVWENPEKYPSTFGDER